MQADLLESSQLQWQVQAFWSEQVFSKEEAVKKKTLWIIFETWEAKRLLASLVGKLKQLQYQRDR